MNKDLIVKLSGLGDNDRIFESLGEKIRLLFSNSSKNSDGDKVLLLIGVHGNWDFGDQKTKKWKSAASNFFGIPENKITVNEGSMGRMGVDKTTGNYNIDLKANAHYNNWETDTRGYFGKITVNGKGFFIITINEPNVSVETLKKLKRIFNNIPITIGKTSAVDNAGVSLTEFIKAKEKTSKHFTKKVEDLVDIKSLIKQSARMFREYKETYKDAREASKQVIRMLKNRGIGLSKIQTVFSAIFNINNKPDIVRKNNAIIAKLYNSI